MNRTLEEQFVHSFIRRTRWERLLYELTAANRRYRGLSRFCHGAEELLDPQRITARGRQLFEHPVFQKLLADQDTLCLILSPDGSLDGERMIFRDAVQQAVQCMDAVIIAGPSFAAVFGEPMKGEREMYLLSAPAKN